MTVSAHDSDDGPGAPPGAWTATSSGWTSARCPAAPWWSGSATAPKLGTAVCAYRHAVMDAKLAATGEPLPPDWALQDPEDYRDVLREAVPGRGAGGRHRPGPGDRHRHRLHRLHRAAGPARRHPAVPGARAGGPPARLPQAVEAPRGPAPGGPDQRAGPRAGRAVDRPVRRQDLLGVAVRQGAPAAGGGPGHLPAGGPLDRGGRLDHLAAVRHRDPQRLHRRVQGHLPGRPLPLGGLPRRAEPRLRQLRRGQAGPSGVAAGGPGGRADRRGGRRGRGCPRASPSPSATWTRTSPRPPPTPSRLVRWWPSWAPRPAT